MKIVFVCDTMGAGGAERVISTLSNQFVKKGHEVSIIILSRLADSSFYQLDKKIEQRFLTKGLKKDIGFFKKAKLLRKNILETSPDIVISFLSYVCIYTWWALKNTNVPYIVSERNDPNHRGIFKQLLLNKAFKNAAGCVFQTVDAESWYKNIIKNNTAVIYNPVNLEFVPSEISERKKQILYVGRFSEQKNCLMLIDAFKIFSDKHPDYVLKMYGGGSQEDLIRSRIKEVGLDDRIQIHSSSKTWQKDECNSSIFVLPSLFEGMPNVLAEALCLGIPSVSTNCTIGGPKELKKLFPNLLRLTNTISSDDLAAEMELSLDTHSSSYSIPNELSEDLISDKWIEFIEKCNNKE